MAETIPCLNEKHNKNEDDSALVRTAQQSLAGFKQLYLKWLSPVYRYFFYRVGNAKDAEDLTSQVFLKVAEELPRYQDHGYFPAWLFSIARNKAVDFFRKEHHDVSLETIDPIDDTQDLLAAAVHTDETLRLNDLIRSLPEGDQELIRLRFVVGLGYREIGVLLHRSEDAVRKSMSRLLARLQSQLEGNHE